MRDEDSIILEEISLEILFENWSESVFIPAVRFEGLVYKTGYPDGGHFDVWVDIVSDKYPELSDNRIIKLVKNKYHNGGVGEEGFYDKQSGKFLTRVEAMHIFKRKYRAVQTHAKDKLHSGDLGKLS